MTINHEDLIAEARMHDRAKITRDLADALEQATARLREAEACIAEALDYVRTERWDAPNFDAGESTLSRYSPTSQEGT